MFLTHLRSIGPISPHWRASSPRRHSASPPAPCDAWRKDYERQQLALSPSRRKLSAFSSLCDSPCEAHAVLHSPATGVKRAKAQPREGVTVIGSWRGPPVHIDFTLTFPWLRGMIPHAIQVPPLRVRALWIEEVWKDAPDTSPPLLAPKTAAGPTITPSRSHSWRALRRSQVVAWSFPRLSSPEIPAAAGEDNGLRATCAV
jgi:hypothetical protein